MKMQHDENLDMGKLGSALCSSHSFGLFAKGGLGFTAHGPECQNHRFLIVTNHTLISSRSLWKFLRRKEI